MVLKSLEIDVKILSCLPIIFSPIYRKSYKEIIYIGKEYIFDRKVYELVRHEEFRDSFGNFHYHPYTGEGYLAFGILVNTFDTNLLLLDYDSKSISGMAEKVLNLINHPSILSIDLIESSLGSWHIIAGLTTTMSVHNAMRHIPDVCKGFIEVAAAKNELVLRVSGKFCGEKQKDIPKYAVSLRKYSDKVVMYNSVNFPITASTTSIANLKKVINLR